MKRVLIVEDDENKRRQIHQFLKDSFPSVEIETARSYNSGVAKLKDSKFAACILDMALPSFDIDEGAGGNRRPFGGREILRKVTRENHQTKYLILTQFKSFGEDEGEKLSWQELKEQLRSKYSEAFADMVFYSSSSNEWKQEVGRFVREFLT